MIRVSTNRHNERLERLQEGAGISVTELKQDLGTTTGGGPTGLAPQGLGANHFTPLLTAPPAAHACVTSPARAGLVTHNMVAIAEFD